MFKQYIKNKNIKEKKSIKFWPSFTFYAFVFAMLSKWLKAYTAVK